MRRLLTGIPLLFVLLSPPLRAAERSSSLSERVAGPATAPLTLSAGATVFLVGESGFPGLSLNFSGHVGRGLYVGIETGVGYREGLATTPVLATAEWRLRARGLSPFLGVAIGGVSRWGRDTNWWRLALLGKPGVELGLGDQIAVRLEPRVGFFGRDFVFAPVVGATFSL